ncbi:hydroxyisourate hydrolase [Micromonospora sp. NPDC006766]|uniref:hydroxyisourate hydrolase n=1 Tax=Micromonospora sp. NPDC006766 TaxID=3154778 RepID=UPI0033CC710A
MTLDNDRQVISMGISARALDGVYGTPATGLRARLEQSVDGCWLPIADAETNADGTIDDFVTGRLLRGPYRIIFDSDQYFSALGASAAYPEIIIVFRLRSESRTCQVQVLMTPYSYSLYFGDRA